VNPPLYEVVDPTPPRRGEISALVGSLNCPLPGGDKGVGKKF